MITFSQENMVKWDLNLYIHQRAPALKKLTPSSMQWTSLLHPGIKTVPIFSDRIRNRICLEELRSVRIRVRISNIRYRVRIRILKLHIYDVDIQSYPIQHG